MCVCRGGSGAVGTAAWMVWRLEVCERRAGQGDLVIQSVSAQYDPDNGFPSASRFGSAFHSFCRTFSSSACIAGIRECHCAMQSAAAVSLPVAPACSRGSGIRPHLRTPPQKKRERQAVPFLPTWQLSPSQQLSSYCRERTYSIILARRRTQSAAHLSLAFGARLGGKKPPKNGQAQSLYPLSRPVLHHQHNTTTVKQAKIGHV